VVKVKLAGIGVEPYINFTPLGLFNPGRDRTQVAPVRGEGGAVYLSGVIFVSIRISSADVPLNGPT